MHALAFLLCFSVVSGGQPRPGTGVAQRPARRRLPGTRHSSAKFRVRLENACAALM